MVFYKIIVNQIVHFLRNIYWLIRLTKINFDGNPKQITFPCKIEGKGKIKIGKNARLKKSIKIGVSKDTILKIGDSVILNENTVILIGKNSNTFIGNNFRLGERTRLYIQNSWNIGNNVTIETYCSIFSRETINAGRLSVGDGSRIGDNTIIDLVDDVEIGNNVAIGPNCTFYTHDHIYTNKNLPTWKGGIIKKPIIIEDDSWIGANVTILPGVLIGRRSIVAAGSVVTTSVPSNSIYAGVPAKLIKRIEFENL